MAGALQEPRWLQVLRRLCWYQQQAQLLQRVALQLASRPALQCQGWRGPRMGYKTVLAWGRLPMQHLLPRQAPG